MHSLQLCFLLERLVFFMTNIVTGEVGGKGVIQIRGWGALGNNPSIGFWAQCFFT